MTTIDYRISAVLIHPVSPQIRAGDQEVFEVGLGLPQPGLSSSICAQRSSVRARAASS
ncbi:hypothetical protein ACIPK5_33615 [Streptomyces sp. NPDC086843]|uniref:hypothetical protein n=1 Tax=Streptomyces sp. NPDC086843 TaxID=3365763 RepID=UPI00382D9BF6